jgi:hypothetical protein
MRCPCHIYQFETWASFHIKSLMASLVSTPKLLRSWPTAGHCFMDCSCNVWESVLVFAACSAIGPSMDSLTSLIYCLIKPNFWTKFWWMPWISLLVSVVELVLPQGIMVCSWCTSHLTCAWDENSTSGLVSDPSVTLARTRLFGF